MLQNAQMALDFLRYKKIKLVNIRAEDIVDGNPKLTLGLIWTIILHFQVIVRKYQTACRPTRYKYFSKICNGLNVNHSVHGANWLMPAKYVQTNINNYDYLE